MEDSPKGREIQELEGDAGPIHSRGQEIADLAAMMDGAANHLQDLADGKTAQKGLAVDKLREVVGDAHEDLRKAADRYAPVGPALKDYAAVLAEVKPLLNAAVGRCEEEWGNYQAKSGAVFDAGMTPPTEEPEDAPDDFDPMEARNDAVEAAEAAKATAHQAFVDEAEVFDGHYDDWVEAFDEATQKIKVIHEGNITDSRWDDLDGFVGGVLEVLKWVGLAVAVLGIIIGGPFLAALGAIIAIATLALTIYAFARGDAGVLDLVLAVVGVIPFGSLGKLFSGNKMAFLDDMFGGLLTGAGRGAIGTELAGLAGAFSRGFSRGGGGLAGLLRGSRGASNFFLGSNGRGVENVIARLFTGSRINEFDNMGNMDKLFGITSFGPRMFGPLNDLVQSAVGD
jgi:hypothetical protein